MDYVSNLICIFPIVLYYLPLKRLDHNRLRCKFSKSSLKLSPQLQDGTRRCTFRCSLGLRSQTRRFPPNHISDDPSRVQSFILGHLHYVKRIATNLWLLTCASIGYAQFPLEGMFVLKQRKRLRASTRHHNLQNRIIPTTLFSNSLSFIGRKLVAA